MRDRVAVRPTVRLDEPSEPVSVAVAVPRAGDGIAGHKALSTTAAIAILAAHAPLGLVMDRVPAVATVHAFTVFALGTWWALSSARLDRVAMVVGYLAGAEVLWRMTDAQINWEFGKYAAAAVMLLALLRQNRLKPAMLPFAYFLPLLPSIALTVANENWATARDQISFNLSGPFALLMCAWFFCAVRLSKDDLRTFWVMLIAPAVAVAAVTAAGTATASNVYFADASNFVTSGGFGPNQVSASLGLGALAAFYIALDETAGRGLRFLMGAVLVALAAESALTFSRGGLYMAAGGAFLALVFAMKDARLRMKMVPVLGVLFVVGNFAVLPYLDAFTGGEMSVRFQDTGLTGRDRLIQADIDLWKANPLLGVGPGQGGAERARVFTLEAASPARYRPRYLAAHTEFSRLVSEHGVLGLISLLVLILAGAANLRRAPDARSRAIVAGLACWSALFMASYAMRTLAPSLMFGIGFATFLTPTEEETEAVARARFVRRRRQSWRPLTIGHPSLGARPTPDVSA